ncbi:MAG: DUF1553 domain-containing protein [Phycisphaerales bacterium]|nr:DUF1553 domain-containing protein [Phycisphaerales bacterium]MCB9864568.1 DUF1553 domain-containing protein [Phycisphaerales bacterium]
MPAIGVTMRALGEFRVNPPDRRSVRATGFFRGVPEWCRIACMAFGVAAALLLSASDALGQFPSFKSTRPAGPKEILKPLPAEKPTPPDVKFGKFRPFNAIDRFILDRIKTEKIRPKNVCDDWTFARRASLDLVGIVPALEDLELYMRWEKDERRAKWVDLLLEQRYYADRWTIVFGDLLREQGRVPGAPANGLRDYLHAAFEKNMPFDELVRSLVSAEGDSERNPATGFLLRDRLDADVLAVSVTDAFLGVSLKCAQCHDHPFDYWTQDDFKGMAGFYRGTRRDFSNSDTDGQRPTFGVRHNPRRAEGRFLTGAVSSLGDGPSALAELITSRDNPYFARVIVNRLWEQMMGVGLVNPAGNLSPLNPPSHPELLDWLAIEFIDSGYDVKHMLRLIATSRTYQQTSSESLTTWASVVRHNKETPSEEDDLVPGSLYEGMRLRRMSAEQINDSILVSTGYYPGGYRGNMPSAKTTYPPRPRSFLRIFGASDRETLPDGTADGSIQQALSLMNGDFVNGVVRSHPGHPIVRWRAARRLNTKQLVDAIFYQVLTREPTQQERKWAMDVISDSRGDAGWEDLQWALFNTREFQFIR